MESSSSPDGLAGREFVAALAAKDSDRLLAVLDPAVDFKGLTPGRIWEAESAEEVLHVLLGAWFEDHDRIEGLLSTDRGVPVGDIERVAYRFALACPSGPFTVEQQAYYRTHNGRINYMRVLCSGFRPG